MGRVVAELADRAILTSDNPRSEDPEAIAAEVAAGALGGARAGARPSRPRSSCALGEARPGDVVLIAGRGAEPRAGARVGEGAVRRPRRRPQTLLAAWRRGRDPARARPDRAARAAHGARPWADEVTGMQIDSRRIEEGDLFVAVGARRRLRRRTRSPAEPRPCSFPTTARRARRDRAAPCAIARRPGGRNHRRDRQDDDEGHPRCALRAAPAPRSPPRRTSTTSSACR